MLLMLQIRILDLHAIGGGNSAKHRLREGCGSDDYTQLKTICTGCKYCKEGQHGTWPAVKRTLEERRIRGDLIECYKILTGKYYVSLEFWFCL